MSEKEAAWFEKLGFKHNPFMIKPYAYNEELHGYKPYIQKINNSIKNGKVIFIEGDYGIGKTSVLKQVIDEFKGQNKLIYYSANRSEGGIDFDALIKGRAGFFGKMFGNMPKNLILMIDEAQKMNMHDCEKIENLIDEEYFSSVILVSDDMKKVNLSKKLKKLIGKEVIDLNSAFTESNAQKMVKDRLGDESDFMPSKAVKLIYLKSNKNPRRMLENLEDVSRFVIEEKDKKKVSEADVKEALKDK